MKKLILSLIIAGATMLTANAQFSLSTNIGAFRTISMFSNGATIYSIQTVNTNTVGTNTVTYFYDAPGTNNYYTNAPYTNITRASGFATNIFTNVLGVIWTNSYPAILTTTSVVTTPLTNFYPMVYQATTISNNGTTTYIPPQGIRVNSGLLISNAQSAVNVTINYNR